MVQTGGSSRRSCRHISTSSCPGDTEDDVSSLTKRTEMPDHSLNIQADAVTFNPAPCPVTLHIITDSQKALPLLDLYQQVINWVDPKLKLFLVTERTNASCQSQQEQNVSSICDIPAIAMTIFLRGADQDGDDSDGLEKAQQIFQHPPWRIHHTEKLGHNKINSLANNSHDFYYTSRDLPLWAARHVHYGREHIRYALYVSDISWPDQVNFYRLILNLEADLVRDDFCLFTVYTQDRYDVQFALKKLDSNQRILTLQSVQIHVKVKDSGHLVPLFPNVCHPISDAKWQTTDHDGNVIVIDASSVVSPTNNAFTLNTINRKPEQAAKIDNNFTFSQLTDNRLKEQPYLTRSMVPSNLQFGLPELTLNLTNNSIFSHQLESPATSDLDDFGIDLPSPPLRHISKPEEDEESLAFTNTSEESGIQMQPGCEDLSFCEDEGLRSCLSKNSILKVRHVKFKVRFKEEVQTFEYSFSRPSPCYENDDHSEAEMETRFPYVPTSEEKSRKLEQSSEQAIQEVVVDMARFGLQTISSNNCAKSHASFPPASLSVAHTAHSSKKRQICVRCDQDANRYPHSSDQDANRYPHNSDQDANRYPHNSDQDANRYPHNSDQDANRYPHNSDQDANNYPKTRDDSPVLKTSLDIAAATCNRHQIITPPQRMSDSYVCPSNLYRHTSTGKQNGQHFEHNTCFHCPCSQRSSCWNCTCSKNQTFNTIHRTQSSNELGNTFLSQTKEQQSCGRPSYKITPVTDSQVKQHINRLASDASLLNKELQPTTPPTTDKKRKHFSGQSNSQENKTIKDNRHQSDPCFQTQHVQNGQKRFWFADTNLDLARSGCSDQEETTLKFTLKYDTCPTSGLSSGQEQIGFYV